LLPPPPLLLLNFVLLVSFFELLENTLLFPLPSEEPKATSKVLSGRSSKLPALYL